MSDLFGISSPRPSLEPQLNNHINYIELIVYMLFVHTVLGARAFGPPNPNQSHLCSNPLPLPTSATHHTLLQSPRLSYSLPSHLNLSTRRHPTLSSTMTDNYSLPLEHPQLHSDLVFCLRSKRKMQNGCLRGDFIDRTFLRNTIVNYIQTRPNNFRKESTCRR